MVAPCGYRLEGAEELARQIVRSGDLPEGVPVWAVDADAAFVRPGPRLIEGVETLAHIAHPEAVQPPRECSGASTEGPALFSRTIVAHLPGRRDLGAVGSERRGNAGMRNQAVVLHRAARFGRARLGLGDRLVGEALTSALQETERLPAARRALIGIQEVRSRESNPGEQDPARQALGVSDVSCDIRKCDSRFNHGVSFRCLLHTQIARSGN